MTRRWVIVLLTIAAWTAASNHCALGLTETDPDRARDAGECPMHSSPTKEKPGTDLPCCKELRATVHPAAKSISTPGVKLGTSQDHVAAVSLTWPQLSFRSICLDTGPPGSISFAESVLQRSLCAHGPPAA
jgi:hypothetical protein